MGKDPSDVEKVGRATKGKETVIALVVLIILIIVIIGVVAWVAVQTQEAEEAADKPSGKNVSHADRKQMELMRRRAELASSIHRFPGDKDAPNVYLTDFVNWDTTVKKKNVFHVKPRTLEEVQRIVKAAKTMGMKVRPVGKAFSYSDIFGDEEQVFLDSSDLRYRENGDPPMKVMTDQDGTTVVKVLAGMTVGELVDFMVKSDVQFLALPVIRNALVGASVNTGSHGGGIYGGVMGENLMAVTLVNADGEVKEYSEYMDQKAMAALRCCVGMCGIFYELAFKVDPLQNVTSVNYLTPVEDVMSDPSKILEFLDTGDYIAHFIPLSSWSKDEWDTYSANQTFPETYDPWKEHLWIKHSSPIAGGSEGRRKRRSAEPLPALYGVRETHHQKRQRRNADFQIIVHKYAYDYEIPRIEEGNNTNGPYPDMLVRYDADAEGTQIIQEIGMAIRDSSDLSRGMLFYKMVLDHLKKNFDEKKEVPLLTMVNRWVKPSTMCYLCPNRFEMVNDSLVFTLSFTFDRMKSAFFVPWFNELFPALTEQFPDMRFRWAFLDEEIVGLSDQIKASLQYGDDMTNFKNAYNDMNTEGFFESIVLKNYFD